MTVIDQSITVRLESQSLRKIEQFVEYLCDQLLINDTYYGNILMAITETFSLCLQSTKQTSVVIAYTTDYQEVTVFFKPVEQQIIDIIKDNPGLEETEGNDNAQHSFIINSLTEEIQVVENEKLGLVFDISAVHSKVYQYRQKKVDDYFKQLLTKSLRKRNDNN